MAFPWILLWCAVSMPVILPLTVYSDPIKVDFSTCRPGVFSYDDHPELNTTGEAIQCCPLMSTKPAIDGIPPLTTKFLRVRRASQCTDAAYNSKLNKAYALMRALPDDDPRSLLQQWYTHCAYCGGSFVTTSSERNTSEGIDIHFSWLFYPWHRYFLYFHERILQSLLGDPTFSLNFWNWDNPYSVGDGSSKEGACLKAGHDFPAIYSDKFASTYDGNRSENAKGNGPLHFPDLTFNPILPAVKQPMYNASAEVLIKSNLKVLSKALVSGGTTTETFVGLPYRAGDPRGNPTSTGGGGILELTAHNSVHLWTGQDYPPDYPDMGALAYSARDPVFYSHHANIDRIFQVWKSIGPSLGQNRQYYSDPDFLNTEFVFYDENKDLRRVKVGDALETENLGYVYQQANDAAWINANYGMDESPIDSIASSEHSNRQSRLEMGHRKTIRLEV